MLSNPFFKARLSWARSDVRVASQSVVEVAAELLEVDQHQLVRTFTHRTFKAKNRDSHYSVERTLDQAKQTAQSLIKAHTPADCSRLHGSEWVNSEI